MERDQDERLAAFELSLAPGENVGHQYWKGQQVIALEESERKGIAIFFGKSKPIGNFQMNPESQWRRLSRWVDRRTGLAGLLHENSDNLNPGKMRSASTFGSRSLFVLLSQFIAGIFLALYCLTPCEQDHGSLAIISFLLMAFPFFRLWLGRRFRQRPIKIGALPMLFVVLASLSACSSSQSSHNKNGTTQAQQVVAGGPLAARTSTSSPASGSLVAEGKKIFQSHGCYACHGQGAVGTSFAPKLIGIGKKFSTDQMVNLFKNPLPPMEAGGMPHFTFTPDQVKAIRAYLDSPQ